MKKSASIYLRDQTIFVSSSSRTKDGIWIEIGEVHVVSVNDIDALTTALREALEESRHGLPTPPPHEDLTAPLRRAANVKTWQAFASRAKHVDVYATDGLATITPYLKVTARGNFEPQPDKKRTSRVASDSLGAVILDALSDAS